ncbi:uncharacterized protein [Epargyreus clarus]|uniref:uncharacterized protein n=1 Tax=Epargyreus clarus TaxID=520877 RepID=UPI003C2E617B
MTTNPRKGTDPTPMEESDQLTIRPLGAGQEVGRSCIMLEFKGKKIMLDCGIHPGLSGMDALPFVDLIEADEVDLLLISHFHLDHSGALPWFLTKTSFKGRVFMTHATKAIYRWLVSDYIKVSNISTEQMLYTESDLEGSMDRIETINFHEERDVRGVRFWAYNAGHVLGAAMFMIEIAGVKVLYTGDFSRQEDRHLMAAEIPTVHPDVLITESTYGTHIHEKREERESRFTGLVSDIVMRGGRCLIPVFALGRAQELLLILGECPASAVHGAGERHRNARRPLPHPRVRAGPRAGAAAHPGSCCSSWVSAQPQQCTGRVSDIVMRGGRCLIPVFALGRAQELLLILGECPASAVHGAGERHRNARRPLPHPRVRAGPRAGAAAHPGSCCSSWVSAQPQQCTGRVSDIVMRGGRCLIPVFALGRAQELLLILGECPASAVHGAGERHRNARRPLPHPRVRAGPRAGAAAHPGSCCSSWVSAQPQQCTGRVSDIVMRGGRCLIPVFALGRAQELLLILGECPASAVHGAGERHRNARRPLPHPRVRAGPRAGAAAHPG